MDTQACPWIQVGNLRSFSQQSTSASHCGLSWVCSTQTTSKEGRWNKQRISSSQKANAGAGYEILSWKRLMGASLLLLNTGWELSREQRTGNTQQESNSSPKLGKKILMASQAHSRKPQETPNIRPQTAGLDSSSCRPHGPQQKVRSFMGNGPKLPNVLFLGEKFSLESWAWKMMSDGCKAKSSWSPRCPNSPF